MLPSLFAAIGVHNYLPGVAALPEGIRFIKSLGYVLRLARRALWGSAVVQMLMGLSKGRLVTTALYAIPSIPV